MTNKLGSANPNRIPQRKKIYKDREYLRLVGIYNYYKVPNLFETSGQPNVQELKLLSKFGYQVIINLSIRPTLKAEIIAEEEILKSLKVKYIHLPVDFNNPTQEDFEKFILKIQRYKDKKIWVHCEANMRVSAFVYKYRRDVLKLTHDEIIGDMKAIWKPNRIWNSFLNLDDLK